MSNIYISEPPTNGKVLLNTSVGEIELELWSKETPKACRNFVQLCMEGYYNGTIFHRVVPGFIVQGGDPTGTGEGGESIYEKPFKVETHSRLRFNRRGLVAMAIQQADCNRSQFFFTLDATPELEKRHTIFAKIAGQTIYNMIKLAESPLDHKERPLNPQKIINTEIIYNPFKDIIPREIVKAPASEGKKKRDKPKGSKNFSLLSFGEEAEEDEQETDKIVSQMRGKGKSSHDLLNDPRLSSVPVAIEPVSDSDKNYGAVDTENEEKKQRLMSGIKEKLSLKTTVLDAQPEVEPISKIDALREEATQIKREIRQSKRAAIARDQKPDQSEEAPSVSSGGSNNGPIVSVSDNDLLNSFHASQDKYRELCRSKQQIPLAVQGVKERSTVPPDALAGGTRKPKAPERSIREERTLALLSKFQSKLRSAVLEESGDGSLSDVSTFADKTAVEEEEEDVVGSDWLKHKLHFEEPSEKKVMDANRYDPDRYDIADPRNPINIRKRKSSSKHKHEDQSSNRPRN